MVAVDEFELGAQATAPTHPRPGRGRHRDRPGFWVGLAVTAVALGVLAAPEVLPRASGEIPGWGGLGGIDWVTVEGDVDAVEVAELVLSMGSTHDAEGRVIGTVVALVRAPVAGGSLGVEPGTAVMDTESGAITSFFPDGLFAELEALAPRSDWVCEAVAEQALCTALADPEISVVVDWPFS